MLGITPNELLSGESCVTISLSQMKATSFSASSNVTWNVKGKAKATLDSNFRICFYTADNVETGRYWSEYITVPNDGNWHRVVWNSFTNPSNSQSNSLSFHF